MVVSLHQIDYALRYFPRIVALCHGRVRYDGPAAGVNAEMIESIYGLSAASMFGENESPAGAGGFGGFPGSVPAAAGAGFLNA
jgi:phosphonate transport system ATP-binding protein